MTDPEQPLPTTPVAPPPVWSSAPPPLPPQAAIPPPPPPKRDRLALAVVAVIFGGLFLVFFAFLVLAYSAVKGEPPSLGGGPRVGVLELKGPIGMDGRAGVDADEVLKQIKKFKEDSDM